MRSLVPDVSQGPRSVILEVIEQAPGTHLRGIERATELPLGQVLYHLDRLERMGLVVSARESGFRRYFVPGEVARDERRTLAALRHEAPRRIILELLERGPQPHKDLQRAIGVAGSTLSFHLQRLTTTQVVERIPDGGMHRYALVDPTTARRELIYYRGSFHDADVDRYVGSVLAALPPLEARPVHS